MKIGLTNMLEKYDFTFPNKLIATEPAQPRDLAKLLVVGRKPKTIRESTFAHLADFLPTGTVLVFNQTKVIPARLMVTKSTGGKVELLYLKKIGQTVQMLANKKLTIGETLKLNQRHSFVVQGLADKGYLIKPSFTMDQLELILDKHGSTPLPPYIKNSKLSESAKRREYQTVFAKLAGSVAAPTASLHFTKKLLSTLKKRGIGIEFVTLHVGLGTFASLTQDNIKHKKLHEEYYEIDQGVAKRLNQAKTAGRVIIPVGTTALRALESAVDNHGHLKKLQGVTDLFITERYHFKFVNGLITNFHVPKSSLLILVSALVGRQRLLSLYQFAISQNYRLFSFGDGMLIC